MRFLPVNLNAFLVELTDLEQTLALYASLQKDALPGIQELVPAARTLLVIFQPLLTSPGQLIRLIRQRNPQASPPRAGQKIQIPVHYVGEDLNEAAELLGLSPQELIRRHTAQDYRVAFCGFAPGFAYLHGGAGFQLPRRRSPRPRVPAGAVGLAGPFSAVYPKTSPGGWQLIGITPLPMWDPTRTPPALLRPGDRVRFVDAGPLPPEGLPRSAPEPPPPAPPTGAYLEILQPGLQTSLQDLGRTGYGEQGVTASGAADRAALRAANRLVGNPADSACLEVLLGGLRFRCHGPAVMALTGAPAAIEILSATGACLHPAPYRPIALNHGDRVSLSSPRAGLRSYLALRGGFTTTGLLGSLSWDSLAQLGPRPLISGDRLAFQAAPQGATVALSTPPPSALPQVGDTVTLDVILGPRTDWFDALAIDRLQRQAWRVTPESNRIGMRLQGDSPLPRAITEELPSEGVVAGAIQVPANGQPVVFLADHPLTGGYPVIAAVAAYHLDLAGQIPVGATIRFNPLGPFQELEPLTLEQEPLCP